MLFGVILPTVTLFGSQTPRISLVPEALGGTDYADDCIELAQSVGLVLDPWQRLVLRAALSVRPDLMWAAFELALIVSRQNGKGSILEARMLAGLFLFDEGLQLYTSHEFKSAQEIFNRVVGLITNSDALRKRVKAIPTSHGKEGIELLKQRGQVRGNRIRFITRGHGSGRGFTADCIYFDEAYELAASFMAALIPTLSTIPNPQIWYASSAGMETSEMLGAIRSRAIDPGPDDARLAFLEWSADDDNFDVYSDTDLALANPALGIRISKEFCVAERAAMKGDMVKYARERLGIGTYPAGESTWAVIPKQVWYELQTDEPTTGGLVFAVDVSPDRSATIAACGVTPDGHDIVEIVAHSLGTSWVVDRLEDLIEKHRCRGVVISPRGPAGSLLADVREMLSDARKEKLLQTPGGQDEAQACGAFYDAAVDSMSIRHRGQAPLATAVAGAHRKILSEAAWTWNRKSMTVDISPLWAATLAFWGHQTAPKPRKPFILVGS